MAAPPITERHKHHFHRQSPIKELVRCATTANITISTGLNNGDTIDGITLATGDRVLVKNQSTGSQNGIYVVDAAPFRDYDVSTDDPGFGYIVLVLQGTANAGTLWQNTNTATPTIGTTALTFAAVGGSASFATPAIVLGSSAAAGAASTVIRSDSTIAAFDATNPTTQAFGDSAVVGTAAFAARRDHKHAMPTAAITTSGLTQATARLLGRSSASTGAVEEITVGTGLSLSGGDLSATGGAATITTKDEGSTLSTTVTTLDFTGAGVTASGSGATTTVNIPGGSSGLTQAFVGYNTIGGSTVSMTSHKWYAKKFTTTGACLLVGIGAYISQQTSVNAHAFGVALWDHNSTKPGLILTWNFAGQGANAIYQIVLNKNSAPGTARWIEMPVSYWLAASTDYWIGVIVSLNSGTFNLSKDGSGSDRTMTATGTYGTDWDYFTEASTTDKYSIRGNTIA